MGQDGRNNGTFDRGRRQADSGPVDLPRRHLVRQGLCWCVRPRRNRGGVRGAATKFQSENRKELFPVFQVSHEEQSVVRRQCAAGCDGCAGTRGVVVCQGLCTQLCPHISPLHAAPGRSSRGSAWMLRREWRRPR